MSLGFHQGYLWPSLPIEKGAAMPAANQVREMREDRNAQDDFHILVSFFQRLEDMIQKHPASKLSGSCGSDASRSKLAVFGPDTVVHTILTSDIALPPLGKEFTKQEEKNTR